MTSSFLLCILLYIKVSFALLEKWLGLPFLNHHFPITFLGYRGVYPFAIFLFTLFVIFSIETYTSQFVYPFETESMKEMEKGTLRLLKSDKVLEAVKNERKMMEQYLDTARDQGFFGKIVNHPKIYNFIDFFKVKR